MGVDRRRGGRRRRCLDVRLRGHTETRGPTIDRRCGPDDRRYQRRGNAGRRDSGCHPGTRRAAGSATFARTATGDDGAADLEFRSDAERRRGRTTRRAQASGLDRTYQGRPGARDDASGQHADNGSVPEIFTAAHHGVPRIVISAERDLSTAETHWQRWTMDMQIIVTDPDALALARRVVNAELDAIDLAASRFNPDSEINALARCGRPMPISTVLAELLSAALVAAEQTDGDIDPTIGARLIELGYDRDIAATDSAVPLATSATQSADWSMISLVGQVAAVPRGVVLDLGATAKAIAADRCAARAYGETGVGVLVNLGGDIATAGEPPEGGWHVLVRDGEEEPAVVVALPAGLAIATSSTLRRRWWRGGQALHHIIDPRSNWPSDPVWRTVSVTAQSCLAANTVSTAAVIRGWRAIEWIRAQPVSARLVDSDRIVHTVGGWPPDHACEWR